ncbi:MAG: hypothetical protein CK548_04305 [Opitutia bacterium]|nr:MAG: hypothetical protein CK548_04305 [Opitutae bacterium]
MAGVTVGRRRVVAGMGARNFPRPGHLRDVRSEQIACILLAKFTKLCGRGGEFTRWWAVAPEAEIAASFEAGAKE